MITLNDAISIIVDGEYEFEEYENPITDISYFNDMNTAIQIAQQWGCTPLYAMRIDAIATLTTH